MNTNFCSPALIHKDELTYEVLNPGDTDQTASCVNHTLALSEPLSGVMRLHPALAAPISDVLCDRAAKSGLSMVLKERASGKVIGFSLSEDFAAALPESMSTVDARLRPVLALLRSLEEQYVRSRPTIPGQFLHIVAMGLHPRYTQKGLATTLVRKNLDLAKHRGYLGAVATSTGLASRHILRDKLGFRERFRIDYRSYAYEGVYVFRQIEAQSGCSWME